MAREKEGSSGMKRRDKQRKGFLPSMFALLSFSEKALQPAPAVDYLFCLI